MGKEWYWGGGKSSKRGGGGEEDKENANTPTGCMCAVFQLFDFHQFQFALHQEQQDSFKPNSVLPDEETPIPKSAEAPTNSLEFEESSSLPSTIKEHDESLNIPMGIQIKTNEGTAPKVLLIAPNDSSSSSSSYEVSLSPSTKTPNLVARLMGLDLLPDHNSSPISSAILGTPNLQGKSHLHNHFRTRQPLQSKPTSHRSCLDSDFTGSRSLPETPRISSARRSDVEHRLSLQINKENMGVSEELGLSRVSSLRRRELKTEEESRSPGHYAKQIVKQVKESVSRKVGLDITNTVRNREHTGRDQLVSQCKSKKLISKALNTKDVDVSSPGKYSSTPSSCSPRLKFIEPKNKPITSTVQSIKDHNTSHQPVKPPLSTSSHVNFLPQNTKASSITPSSQLQQQQQQRPIKNCKKVAEEKCGPPPARPKKPLQTSYIIKNKQEEPFVYPATAACRANIPDKKCKKTPLSNDLLLNISVPTLLPVKKDPTPLATKIPQKQVLPIGQELKPSSSQLSSCSSQTYKQLATHVLGARDSTLNNENKSNGGNTTTITTGDETAEHEYISRILRRTGIDKDTPVSFTRWFSPSHPLDPSIFYHLEHFPNTTSAAAEAAAAATATTTNSEKYVSLGQLVHRWNRKLLFHLVDEILVEILSPYVNMKPWAASSIIRQDYIISHMEGSHLVDMLCTKVRSFPCADCRVLEDIDGLIGKDLPQLEKEQSEVALGEEGEGIVKEIEKDILDMLIHEMVVIILYGEGH